MGKGSAVEGVEIGLPTIKMFERYTAGGRELIIGDVSIAPQEVKAITRQAIFEFFQKNKLALKIKRLKIVLSDSKQGDSEKLTLSFGQFRPEYRCIVLYLNAIRSGIIWSLVRQGVPPPRIVDTIAHEALHQLSFEINRNKVTGKVVYARLLEHMSLLRGTLKNLMPHERSVALRYVRLVLRALVDQVQEEGIAEFVGTEAKGELSYTKEKFLELYEKAVQQSRFYLQFFSLLRKKVNQAQMDSDCINRLKELLRDTEHFYTIGLHMCHAIVYSSQLAENNDVTNLLTDLLNLSSFNYIKLYETEMEKYGLQPVFSLTSRKGILDYARLVEELVNT